MKTVKCHFCPEQIWYGENTTDDFALKMLNIHVRANHLAEWRAIQHCLTGVTNKLKTWLEITGDVAVDEAEDSIDS